MSRTVLNSMRLVLPILGPLCAASADAAPIVGGAAEVANLVAMAWRAERTILPRGPLPVCYVNSCGESV
jgi:hypothetical protein